MAAAADTQARPQFSKAYRGWFLAMLVAIYACSFLDRVIINTVGPAIIKDLRLSDLEFGLLGGMAFAIFYASFGIPIAWLAERYSRINIVSICIALWSAMTAMCGLSSTYLQLLLFRMGVGIGEAGCGPPAQSLISDHFPPKQRASALAIYTAGVPLGVMIGAVAGGWIAQSFDWRTAFVVVGLPGVLLAVLARLTLREPARGHSEAAVVGAQAPPIGAVIRRLASSGWTFGNVLAGFVLTNLAGNAVSVFTPTYFVRAFHMGLRDVGLLYGMVAGGAGIVGILIGGFGADFAAKRDLRWYAWGPAIGAALAFPIYATAFTRPDPISTAAFIFVGALVLALYFAPTFAIVQNLVEPRMRATAAALILLMINIFGQGLGPTAMGLMSDLMTKATFTLGDYKALCLTARRPHADIAAACASASATGLQHSILVMTAFFAWGSLHYVLAARTIRRDLQFARPA